MELKPIMAIDQGTTGSTVLIVDTGASGGARILGRSTVDFPQHYPRPGWVEHDLEDIWHSVAQAARQALALAEQQDQRFSAKKLLAIGITNQRETLCLFERSSGKPVARAIVWQDKRSVDICQRLKAQGLEKTVRERTGLLLDPYFTGSKIAWVMQHQQDLAARIRKGEVVMGNIDAYLISRLTAGSSFKTEASNASRTLLYDIKLGRWDQELLDAMQVPGPQCLPQVQDSASEFGTTREVGFIPDGIPITGVLGDQQAALAGQTCYEVGEAKCTYGTGAFLLVNTGKDAPRSQNGLITTVAWSLAGQLTYALEGSAFVAGAVVQFLRDQFGFLHSSAEASTMAKEGIGAPQVYFVPALAGLGAPYWEPRATGTILGLTRGTSKAQVVRAALEGIAFEVCDLLTAMRQDMAREISVLRVDGGAAANDLLMQAQADFAGLTVDRPANLETTALGAALFAGLGSKVFSSVAELKHVRRAERLFAPQITDEVAVQLAGWRRAIKAVQVFAQGG